MGYRLTRFYLCRRMTKIKLYDKLLKGTYIDRPNRFVVHAMVNGEPVLCHMPNPGRMRELLFPGAVMYVIPSSHPEGKTKYKVVGIEKAGMPILLDTSRCNEVASFLIDHKKILGWESFHVARREVTMGDSRFDLLLEHDQRGESFPVEVKSCTLFGRHGAMFPDAPTVRGVKHVRHLTQIGASGGRAGLLVLAHSGKSQWFLPDFHTDPVFAEAFRQAIGIVDWKVAAITWDSSFSMPDKVRLLPTSKELISREGGNHGDYLLVLYLDKGQKIQVGEKGDVYFEKGYYVYVGSAKRNLEQRLARHQRLRKKMHWHIDYIRQKCQYVYSIPIRTSTDLEHELAAAVDMISDWKISGIGATDCHCDSHIFGFTSNPIHLPEFIKIEENFKINRYDDYFIEKEQKQR